jgi:hypothetical protein
LRELYAEIHAHLLGEDTRDAAQFVQVYANWPGDSHTWIIADGAPLAPGGPSTRKLPREQAKQLIAGRPINRLCRSAIRLVLQAVVVFQVSEAHGVRELPPKRQRSPSGGLLAGAVYGSA